MNILTIKGTKSISRVGHNIQEALNLLKTNLPTEIVNAYSNIMLTDC